MTDEFGNAMEILPVTSGRYPIAVSKYARYPIMAHPDHFPLARYLVSKGFEMIDCEMQNCESVLWIYEDEEHGSSHFGLDLALSPESSSAALDEIVAILEMSSQRELMADASICGWLWETQTVTSSLGITFTRRRPVNSGVPEDWQLVEIPAEKEA